MRLWLQQFLRYFADQGKRPKFTKGHYSCPEAKGPSNFLLITTNLFIKLWGSTSNIIWDILLTREKCPNLQRAITHEMFFLEFIQKLTRSFTHHYQSIHQVSRLYLQLCFRYIADNVKCPKLQKAITHEAFFLEFIQKLIKSSIHHYQSIRKVSRL